MNTQTNARMKMNPSVIVLEALSSRLDNCFSKIQSTSMANDSLDGSNQSREEESIIYAAFISDVKDGRINSKDPTVGKILTLVEDFCDLIEQDFSEQEIPSASF